MTEKKYVIGIDLGTTNSTLAYTSLADDSEIVQLKVPQVVDAGMEDARVSLPSVVYFPLEEELLSEGLGVSWDTTRDFCIGRYAKARGEELPGRLIASAKSWLCHAGVDRRAGLLPWASDEVGAKCSPVEACSRYLSHLKEAWNLEHPEAPFEEQMILVTVPASFDPDARQLTEEACAEAGYPEVILMEEPQAAFYAWLRAREDTWRDELKVGDSILVIDIGGGTTDFSMISVRDSDGDVEMERVAVGSHLLLGGDNMDLALAYFARAKFEEDGHDLDDWQFQTLTHAARRAKEELLSEDAPAAVDLTVQGRGSGLVAGSLSVSVSREEAESLLIDGFSPIVDVDDKPQSVSLGMQQVGLPYAEDARISSHLAAFLAKTGQMPTRVIFNGGALKSQSLRSRLLKQLNEWVEEGVEELPGTDLDCAVSRGAVCYGLARLGRSIRIKGGTSRSYYIGVEDAVPAVPGMPRPMRAVCVVPFGMEEGTERSLEGQEFALTLGEPATFRFFSYAAAKLPDDSEPDVGTGIRAWKKYLSELHPVEATLDQQEGDGKMVKVTLRSKVTELGVLELWCVSADQREWRLEFDVRCHEAVPAVS